MADIEKDVGGLTKGQEILTKDVNILFQEVRKLEEVHTEIHEALSGIVCQLKDVPNDIHKEHHDFLKAMTEKAQERKEFWQDLKLYMAKKGVWHAILVIGALAVLLWNSDLALKLVYKVFNLKGK